jgi:hypothetical protein
MVNEQIVKRLQDLLKLQLCVLEQLEQLEWLTKDLIEDLELDLHGEFSKEGNGKPSARPVEAGDGCPSETGKDKEGCSTS